MFPFPDEKDIEKELKRLREEQERKERERLRKENDKQLAEWKANQEYDKRYGHIDKPDLRKIAENYPPSKFIDIHCYLVSRKNEWRFFSSNYEERASNFCSLIEFIATYCKNHVSKIDIDNHMQSTNVYRFKSIIFSQRYFDLLMELKDTPEKEIGQQFYIYAYCLKESFERYGLRKGSLDNNLTPSNLHLDDRIIYGIGDFLGSLEENKSYKIKYGLNESVSTFLKK